MREDSSLVEDETAILQIRGQAMSRDEQRGGWLPIDGGGMSNVALYKMPVETVSGNSFEYIIIGQRIHDQQLVLDCTLNSNVLYHRANPTFHHWRTPNQVNEKRYGLTFQSSGEATHFEQAVKHALSELQLPIVPKSVDQLANTETTPCENAIFMSMNLPLRSESDSTISTSISPQSNHVQEVRYVEMPNSSSAANEDIWVRKPSERYVKLSRPTKLVCPQLRNSLSRRDSVSSLKRTKCETASTSKQSRHRHRLPWRRKSLCKDYNASPASMPSSRLLSLRSRCIYCREMYIHSENVAGSCPDAPDPFKETLTCLTCLSCANMLLYHCTADSDGDYSLQCCCGSQQTTTDSGHRWRRWILISLLSIFIPCICCYPPLNACHECSIARHFYGPRHKSTLD